MSTRSLVQSTPTRIALAAVLVVWSAISGAAADWPVFKAGRWQLDRTVEGMGPKPDKVSKTECFDPAAERQKQQAMLTKMGCQFSPVTQTGSTYRFSATCKIGGTSSTSNSVLEMQSAEAYTITVDSVTGATKTHEVLTARRLGDCAK